jgi:hypothetical protein
MEYKYIMSIVKFHSYLIKSGIQRQHDPYMDQSIRIYIQHSSSSVAAEGTSALGHYVEQFHLLVCAQEAASNY